MSNKKFPSRQFSERTPLCSISEEQIAVDDHLPIGKCRQIGYSIGGLGSSILSSFMSVYFTSFLLEVAKIEPKYASMIMLLGNFLKAFSDPFVGYLVSQSPNTKYGKFSPWIMASLPFYCIFYSFIWFVPGQSRAFKIAYYLVVYCLVNVANACFIIPYVSSVLAMSSCQQQRDLLVSSRLTFNVFGSIVAMSIYAILEFFGSINGWNQSTPYHLSGIISAVIMAFLGIIAICSIEERFTLDHGRGRWGPIFEPYFKVLKFKPYRLLLCAILFAYLSYQVSQSIFPLYFKYVLNAANIFPICSVIIAVSAAISMFFWRFLSAKIGKKSALTVGTAINLVVLWAHLYIKYNFIVIITACILIGFVVACCVSLIPPSMLPDVIAAYNLQHGHGEEAMFYSILFFIETMSWAVCSSLSTLVLDAAGYDPSIAVQPHGVSIALRLIIGCFAVICSLIAFISVRAYPITEKTRQLMQTEIRRSMSILSKNSISDKSFA